MKFITMKTILSLIVIGMVFSTNTMRSRAQDAGSGNWDNGYVCPQVYIQEGSNGWKDQGEAKIMAPQIENPTSDVNKLGLNFAFTNKPAANSFIVKIGTKVNDKTYYIPYRYLQGDMSYTNPVRECKNLISAFVADNKNKYSLKINLPYATFGWYIKDDQANKILKKINSRAVEASGSVISNKNVIASYAEKYLQKKALLDAASKDKAALDKQIADQKKQAEKLKADLEAIKSQIEEAKKAVYAKQKEIQSANAQLSAANAAVTNVSTQMNNIELAVRGLATPNEEQLEKNKKAFDAVKATCDGQYEVLKKEISSKVADFNKSKAGLEALDEAKFKAGLDTSYPL